MLTTPVLEVGGTHVTAALVDVAAGRTVGPVVRDTLAAHGTAEEILDRIAATADRIAAPEGARWGVAVPGPFDYAGGIGLFKDVGKFEALYGVDVGAGLAARIRSRPAALRFLNDADAFGVGEHVAGAARGERRAVCLTLGTGVGSAFLDAGVPVNDGPLVPPDGSAHLLVYAGRALEDTVSRRAIRAAYAQAAGVAAGAEAGSDGTGAGGAGAGGALDVRDIAALARGGDPAARAVLDGAFRALGEALAPWLDRFAATAVVIGGSIAASWDLIEPALRAGLAAGLGARRADGLALRTALRGDDAALLGAARWAEEPDG